MINTIQKFIAFTVERKHLSRADAAHAFQIIMNGGATPAEIAAFIVALRMKGESPDEIAGGMDAMRAKMLKIDAPAGTIDTCGTGGDGKHTLNVSTAVALVVAACGVPVAKHGGRAVSSASGSADVLKSLGVRIDAAPEIMQSCLNEHHFCFLLAPVFHPAMRHVAPIRQELGIRTIFNVLGPLCNPSTPDFQLVGVFSTDWLEPIASALAASGIKRAWVVHGAGGVDELSTQGTSQVVAVENGAIRSFTVSPEEAGVSRHELSAIAGKDSGYNARAITELLSGTKSAFRDTVIFNAAAALVIAGKAVTLLDGAQLAADAIDSGRAQETLSNVVWKTSEGNRDA